MQVWQRNRWLTMKVPLWVHVRTPLRIAQHLRQVHCVPLNCHTCSRVACVLVSSVQLMSDCACVVKCFEEPPEPRRVRQVSKLIVCFFRSRVATMLHKRRARRKFAARQRRSR